jgi:hypothetical protein
MLWTLLFVCVQVVVESLASFDWSDTAVSGALATLLKACSTLVHHAVSVALWYILEVSRVEVFFCTRLAGSPHTHCCRPVGATSTLPTRMASQLPLPASCIEQI